MAPSDVFLEAGEGTEYRARGSRMTFKALAATTGGAFSLMDRTVAPGSRRPPPHRHDGPEGFFVLDGLFEFTVEDESRVLGAGGFALAPPRAAHTFGNAGDTEARLLIIHAPAADGYFEGLQELWSRAEAPSVEDEQDLMRHHGIEPA